MNNKKTISTLIKIVIALDIIAVIAVVIMLTSYKGSDHTKKAGNEVAGAITPSGDSENVTPDITDEVTPTDEPEVTPEPTEEVTPTDTPEPTPEVTEEPEQDERTIWVEEKLASLSLEQKILQMYIITPEQLTGVSPVTVAGDTTYNYYTQFNLGGIIFYAQNVDNEEQITNMCTRYKQFSKDLMGLPIFISADDNAGDADMLTRAGVNFKAADSKGLTINTSVSSVDNPRDTTVALMSEDVDVFLLTGNFNASYEALKNAVSDGTVSEARIDESVRKILAVKYDMQ